MLCIIKYKAAAWPNSSTCRAHVVEMAFQLFLAVMQVLARLPWLRSLNVVACPLAAAPDYIAAVHRLVPSLQVPGRGNTDSCYLQPMSSWLGILASARP